MMIITLTESPGAWSMETVYHQTIQPAKNQIQNGVVARASNFFQKVFSLFESKTQERTPFDKIFSLISRPKKGDFVALVVNQPKLDDWWHHRSRRKNNDDVLCQLRHQRRRRSGQHPIIIEEMYRLQICSILQRYMSEGASSETQTSMQEKGS